MKVGYPQALLYYKYFPLWERFLGGLGAEVVLSGATTKNTVSMGTIAAESELCLPVKVFYGHLLELKDKVDTIFVPRFVSVEKKSYTCPKFLGLPDMIRSINDELPPLITPKIDLDKGWREYFRTIHELGSNFSSSKRKIFSAYRAGVLALRDYHNQLQAGSTPIEFLEKKKYRKVKKTGLKIGLAGHPYNIYDTYTSMNLIKRLREMGAEVETAEMLDDNIIKREAARLPKKLFWTYEKEVVGTVFHWAHTHSVDGIIYVLSFACGPDSLIQVILEHELRSDTALPMMSLVVDEHSGEAGLITRVEAFVDMLQRKKMAQLC
ncbi:MAG TPA: hypothetical protein ENH19_03770 [Actinobacteria bacterium]|nr:hypothetical protein [Actinomycetes bacterium]HEX21750.1 hypothetical protein [Actinomycetota bacterium]